MAVTLHDKKKHHVVKSSPLVATKNIPAEQVSPAQPLEDFTQRSDSSTCDEEELSDIVVKVKGAGVSKPSVSKPSRRSTFLKGFKLPVELEDEFTLKRPSKTNKDEKDDADRVSSIIGIHNLAGVNAELPYEIVLAGIESFRKLATLATTFDNYSVTQMGKYIARPLLVIEFTNADSSSKPCYHEPGSFVRLAEAITHHNFRS